MKGREALQNCSLFEERLISGSSGSTIYLISNVRLISAVQQSNSVMHMDMGFPGSSMVKNPPAMQETWVRILGQEDPLGKAETHSSILAWKIPWTEEPGELQSMGLQRVRHD